MARKRPHGLGAHVSGLCPPYLSRGARKILFYCNRLGAQAGTGSDLWDLARVCKFDARMTELFAGAGDCQQAVESLADARRIAAILTRTTKGLPWGHLQTADWPWWLRAADWLVYCKHPAYKGSAGRKRRAP